MQVHREDTIGMLVCSSVSTTASITMVLPYYFFPKLLNKQAYAAVFYLGIATLFNSASTIPGTPLDGSFACYYEAIASNIFSLASFSWITVMNYMMFDVLHGGKQRYKIGYITHAICWGIPIFLTTIPLIDMNYGGNGWCFITPKPNVSKFWQEFWYWSIFYAWLWLNIVISILMLIRIQRGAANQYDHTKNSIKDVVKRLQLYPMVIIFCWAFTTASDTMYVTTDDYTFYYMQGQPYIQSIANVLPCNQGLLTTVVFWYTMPDIRKKMYALIAKKVYPSLYESSMDSESAGISGNTNTIIGKRLSVRPVSVKGKPIVVNFSSKMIDKSEKNNTLMLTSPKSKSDTIFTLTKSLFVSKVRSESIVSQIIPSHRVGSVMNQSSGSQLNTSYFLDSAV